jgi:hypothetical protein
MATTGQQYINTFNPKEYVPRRAKQNRVVRVDEFEHPIPAEVRDVGELKKFFDKYRFVPYAGSEKETSHGLLNLLLSMSQNGTQKAVIESLKSHCFGGKLDIVASEDPDFAIEESREVSQAEKIDYRDWIKEGITFYDSGGRVVSLRDFSGHCFDDLKACGNVFVEMVQTETVGVRSVKIYLHKPESCLYFATEKGQPRIVAISPIWREDYLRKNPPVAIPAFPNFADDENGTRRTIIHLRNGNSNWYGRPDSIGSFLYQYRELQDANYLIKLSRGNFTGLVIIEVEEDNPEFSREMDRDANEAGYVNAAERLEHNFTQKGKDPSSIMYLTRPHGARPVTIEQVEPNDSHEWYTALDELSERKIIAAHSWSRRLMGDSQASGFSSNVFLDELKTKTDTVEKNRLNISGLINKILTESAVFFERPDFEGLSIAFTSPFFGLMQKEQDLEDVDNNNSDGGS